MSCRGALGPGSWAGASFLLQEIPMPAYPPRDLGPVPCLAGVSSFPASEADSPSVAGRAGARILSCHEGFEVLRLCAAAVCRRCAP